MSPIPEDTGPSLAEAVNGMEQAAVFVARFDKIYIALKYAANLEQVTSELEKAVEAARAESDQVKADLEQAKADIDAAKAEAADTRQAGKDAAKALKDKAQTWADDLVSTATAKAAEYAAKVDQANADLAVIEGNKAAAQSDLDALNSKIAEARAAAAKILG